MGRANPIQDPRAGLWRFESAITLRDKLSTIAASGAAATGIAAILAYWLKGRRSG